MLGISINPCIKLGDRLIFSSFPENYFRNFGQKVVDLDKQFFFDHNPYVLRDQKVDEKVNLWSLWLNAEKMSPQKTIAHKLCKLFNIKCYLNHPRFYIHEDEPRTYHSLTVHTTGITVGAMPLKVINQIRANYSDCFAVQVGQKTDFDTGFFDHRGQPIWDTIKDIASTDTYIGIDSGLLHVAAAYPKVRLKIVLPNKTEEELERFTPYIEGADARICGWNYTNCEYYNTFERDIGITRSYLLI